MGMGRPGAFVALLAVAGLHCGLLAEEPTNAEESARLAQKSQGRITAREYQDYRALVAALPPEEQAWEKVLEDNLGADYFARYVRQRLKPDWNPSDSEWGFVRDDPRLPNVLVIGDSISRAYTLPLRKALHGKADVRRAPANCGATDLGLRRLDAWLSRASGKWDVITVNFGIHDREKTPEQYAANLEKILDRLEATGACLVWCRTTPFGPDGDGSEMVNRAADAVAARRGLATADLHAAIAPRRQELQNKDGFHFYPEGSRILAAKLAGVIEPLLPLSEHKNSEHETQQTR